MSTVLGRSVDGGDATLVGRERELLRCRAVVDRAKYEGAALLLRGSAGVGKTSLLRMAADHARALGYRVLETTAVEAEASFPFAALAPLLLPVVDEAGDLPAQLRDALHAALGLSTVDVPAPETVGLATLSVFSALATPARPLCVVVDDVHWLDPSSAAVLRFLSRRLAADPIVVVAAGRDGGAIGNDVMPELRVEPLESTDAELVLATYAGRLAAGVRRRILAEAQGNPLALVELGRSARLAPAVRSGDDMSPGAMPLTARLEAAFVRRAHELPETTRAVLLAAAFAPSADLGDVLAAATLLAGEPVELFALDPAEAAGLIEVLGQQVHFTHPLVRSGVADAATASRRQAVHRALAAVVADPDHRLHHLARATVGHDDALADELDRAATTALRRGARDAAVSLLRQAAALSSAGAARGSRTVRAARLSFELGDAESARELMGKLNDGVLDRADRARARMLALALDGGDSDDPGPVWELIGLAESAIADGDADGALELLEFASRLMVWHPGWEGVARALVGTARRVPVPAAETDPRITAIIAQAMPIEAHQELHARLARLDDATLTDPATQQLIGFTSVNLAEYERGAVLLDRAQQQLRAQARLALLATVLTYRGIAAFSAGRWRLALQDLAEAERLVDDTVHESWLNIVHYVRAGILGMQGDDGHRRVLDELAERFERENGSHRDNHLTFMRGIADAVGGRSEDAIVKLGALFDPALPMFEARTCFDALFYLADSAVSKQRPDVVREAVAVLEATVPLPLPPAAQSAVDYASALVADVPAVKRELFESALAGPAGRRPFDRARVQLAYGEWLRRDNRRTEARERLRDAYVCFERLGNEPFAQRATLELRAAGEAASRRDAIDWDRLSPQELQIARLVSQGLSNRQIGEQLFLSHRTISTHLYRMFPKLGITSRTQLAAALRRHERDS